LKVFHILRFYAYCFVSLCRLLPLYCHYTAPHTFYSEVLIATAALLNSTSLSWNRDWLG